MVETFSELGGMVDMLFMIFFFPYSIYNSRVLKERLVEALHGVKKPQKPRKQASVSALTAVSSFNQSQPASPQEDYRKKAKTYQELVESIEACFDLVKIAKEISSIWLVIQSNNLVLPDSIRGGIFESLRRSPSDLNARAPPNPGEDAADEKQADFSGKSKITGGPASLKLKKPVGYHKKISVTNMNSNQLQFAADPHKQAPADVLDEEQQPRPGESSKLGKPSTQRLVSKDKHPLDALVQDMSLSDQ